MSSYLTDAELAALQDALDRDTPFAIRGVSSGYFGIARYYGGVQYQGRGYAYIPETDELVRDDVMKWVAKRRKAAKPKKVKSPEMF